MKKIVISILVCSIIISANCALAKTILKANSESPAAGEVIPPQDLVESILSTMDSIDKELFSKCMKSMGIGKDKTNALFRAVPLPTIDTREKLYFVRPSLGPQCHTFYSSHLFRYWIVKKIKKGDTQSIIVHRGGVADTIEILSSNHLGYPDINEINCWAVGCGTTTLHYNGEKYSVVKCTETVIDKDGNEITKQIPCSKAYGD